MKVRCALSQLVAVVSISLPEELLAQADRVIEKRGFAGRSEFLRACVRDLIAAYAVEEAQARGRRGASLTLVYPEGMERAFSRVRHEFSDVVRSMMHGHAGETCVEIFVLEGESARIRSFADALRASREALQVALVYTDVGPH